MLKHNFTIALRNLLKYKTQNIISIIGLAIGFACFALSALWIRWEMSYDNFHANADRIYRVHTAINKWNPVETPDLGLIQERNSYPLANWLKTTFPEIEEAGNIRPEFPIGHFFSEINLFFIDYGFARIFDLPMPESFFVHGRTDRPAAVVENFKFDAETIKEMYNYDVLATFPVRRPNSIHKVDLFVAASSERGSEQWNTQVWETYILVHSGVHIEGLKAKLDKVNIPEWRNYPISFVITPIKKLR